MVIIDSLDNVRKVLDRSRQYQIIDDSELASEGKSQALFLLPSPTVTFTFVRPCLDGVFTPTFVEMTSTDVQENLNKMKEYSVKFPFGEFAVRVAQVAIANLPYFYRLPSVQAHSRSWNEVCPQGKCALT